MRVLPGAPHRFLASSSILAIALSLALAACGGGGGSAASSTSGSATLAGTVAVGAPMLDATITVKDSKGMTVSAPVAADGSYSGLSLDGLVAPFALQACGFVDGNYTCYYAVVGDAGTGNVTPLTNATVALATGSDPAALFASGAASAPGQSALDAQAAKLRAALGDLLAKAGLGGSTDFATTPFTTDRTGMDKLLDAIKVSTGDNGGTTFVQVEGKIGSGNAYLDPNGGSGSLAAGSGLDVDLRGINRIFVDGLGRAVNAADEATCTSRLAAANVFDAAFTLDIDGTLHVDASNGAATICHFATVQGLLGGTFANPVLKDCDFTSDPSNKVCTVGFNIIKGDLRFEGAELAIVLRTGADWKLLGKDSAYEIHVGAAAQRTIRVDVPAGDARAAPQYTRALSFDIAAGDGVTAPMVRGAKVYQRSLDGTAWEPTPIATLTLTDACLAQTPAGEPARLGIVGSQCGGSWVSLGDSTDGAGATAAGDVLIDNFYKRGRKVRVDLYTDVAMTSAPLTFIKRVEGVPPKFAALATFPWLEADAPTRDALTTADGSISTFAAAWLANPTVSGNDASFCVLDCAGDNRSRVDIVLGHRDASIPVAVKPASASALKMLSLYGRDHDQVGVSSNYVSCGGAQSCWGQ